MTALYSRPIKINEFGFKKKNECTVAQELKCIQRANDVTRARRAKGKCCFVFFSFLL